VVWICGVGAIAERDEENVAEGGAHVTRDWEWRRGLECGRGNRWDGRQSSAPQPDLAAANGRTRGAEDMWKRKNKLGKGQGAVGAPKASHGRAPGSLARCTLARWVYYLNIGFAGTAHEAAKYQDCHLCDRVNGKPYRVRMFWKRTIFRRNQIGGFPHPLLETPPTDLLLLLLTRRFFSFLLLLLFLPLCSIVRLGRQRRLFVVFT
jgi:hypothetical protein